MKGVCSMKRVLTILLALALMLPSALAEYDEHMTFTTSFIETGTADSYTDDAVYRHFADKFNLDFETYTVTWDNWEEKDRIWISSGTMPDLMQWNFKYDEYLTYATQGLIAPMPEGWEQDYPNLYDSVVASGIYEKLLVDGKIYALPRVTFYIFSPIDAPISHTTYYYRKDWAKELGYDFGYTVTIDEFMQFCRDAVAKDMAGNGATIGIAAKSNYMTNLQTAMYVEACGSGSDFSKVNGKYVWNPTLDGTTDRIKALREYYNEGVLDPDFYLDAKSDPKNKFASGLAAALIEDGPCTHFVYRKNEFLAANPDVDPAEIWDYIGACALVSNDGFWYGNAGTNYWTASIFNPEIDEQLQRCILAMIDYACTKEAQEIIALGIPEVDWTYDENGGYKILRPANEDGSYPDIKSIYSSCYFWYIFTVLADDFTFVDPTLDAYIRETVMALYKARAEHGAYMPLDVDYMFFTSEAKSQYSVSIDDEIMRLILDSSVDIDTEWAKFIEDNRALWEPVVNDLNAAFAE